MQQDSRSAPHRESAVRRLVLGQMRLLMLGVGGFVALAVLGALLIDEGEVVVLVTTDDEAHPHETQLWIVEIDGTPYLRASSRDASWLARLRARPDVRVERGDGEVAYRALPVEEPTVLARIDRAMARKYGLADRVWGALGGRSDAVAVQLVPGSGEVISKVRTRP